LELSVLHSIYFQQHIFFNQEVQDLTSSYESAFINIKKLSNLVATFNDKKNTANKIEDINENSLQNKLTEIVNTVFDYKINNLSSSYRLFNEINKKQFIFFAYLARITAIVNKLSFEIGKLEIQDINPDLSEDDTKKLQADIKTVSKIFEKKPNEALSFHFDVITHVLSTNNDTFSIVEGIHTICDDMRNGDTSKDILNENQRIKNQICAKDYRTIYGAIEGPIVAEDFNHAKTSLLHLVKMLQDDKNDVDDIATFLNNR
jgi:hypothetical protein